MTEPGWVIERRDNTGMLAYWTGEAAWAFSVANMDAVRFSRAEDAHKVLDNVVRPSEGCQLHAAMFPNDALHVEDHLWVIGAIPPA